MDLFGGENGLEAGENGLRVIMMCESPQLNALLADSVPVDCRRCFLLVLTILPKLLGLTGIPAIIAHLLDERNDRDGKSCSVERHSGFAGKLVRHLHLTGPSWDHPDLAKWADGTGIDRCLEPVRCWNLVLSADSRNPDL